MESGGGMIKSPEYEEWKLQKEKVEARKNFKQYIYSKIERILKEPALQHKLMSKIEKIKKRRLLEIK